MKNISSSATGTVFTKDGDTPQVMGVHSGMAVKFPAGKQDTSD
jgi:hypothetical protein